MLKLLCICTFIILALAITRFQSSKNSDFKANAGTVKATVTMLISRDANDKKNRKEHYVQYRFETQGKTIDGEDLVEFDDLWKNIHEGDDITVYYSRDDPEKNYPAALIDRRLSIAGKIAPDAAKQ